jgi:hypothetical protein
LHREEVLSLFCPCVRTKPLFPLPFSPYGYKNLYGMINNGNTWMMIQNNG